MCAVDLFEPFDEDECVWVFDGVPVACGFEFFECGEAVEVEVVDGAAVGVVAVDDGERRRADVCGCAEVGLCDAVHELCFSDAEVAA